MRPRPLRPSTGSRAGVREEQASKGKERHKVMAFLEPKQPDKVKECSDGRVMFDYDPVDEYPDSALCGEGMSVVQRKKGISSISAEKKIEKRMDSIKRRSDYRVVVPCIRCTSCVIIRAMEHGEIKNIYYACQRNKMKVERYGTCIDGAEGNGPLVLEKDLTMEEIARHKNELIN